MNEPELIFVALGSNLGESCGTILRAMDCLQEFSEAPLLRSSLWESTPVDCPSDALRFINAVVGWVPRFYETPEGLLAKLQALERQFGREPKRVLNEPRPLDLDLIAFGSRVQTSEMLTLPHPRAHRRRFVLQPLAEIAPDYVLPLQTEPVRTLLANLVSDEIVTRFPSA